MGRVPPGEPRPWVAELPRRGGELGRGAVHGERGDGVSRRDAPRVRLLMVAAPTEPSTPTPTHRTRGTHAITYAAHTLPARHNLGPTHTRAPERRSCWESSGTQTHIAHMLRLFTRSFHSLNSLLLPCAPCYPPPYRHNLPDGSGNRYCINLVCVSGFAPER